MSIQGVWGENCRIGISCPGAAAIGTGAYTVAILFKPNDFQSVPIWKAFQANNFSFQNLHVGSDGDMVVSNDSADTNIPAYSVPPTPWYWFVNTKGSGTEAVRAHYAIYEEIGDLSWTHIDASGSQSNHNDIVRFELGDQFNQEFRGTTACFAAMPVELSDSDIELIFVRSSNEILLDPEIAFFCHWPLEQGIDPTSDLAGGGSEIMRTGNWIAVSDPPGFDFSLGRSGQPKIWDGVSWNKHPAKTYNGITWASAKMSGYNGTEWVTSK